MLSLVQFANMLFKGKLNEKCVNRQHNGLLSTHDTTWQGSTWRSEGFHEDDWQWPFRDKGLPLKLQFDSLGEVANAPNARGFL